VRSADALLDLHAGEFVQDLTPYVCVPWVPGADPGPWERSLALAACFDVPFVNRRTLPETPLALPRALLDAGVPNVWTEIGHNGLAEPATIALQREGLVNVLRMFGILDGAATPHAPKVLGPRQWSVFAETSGIWWPSVRAGQSVAKGEMLGELRDLFGVLLETYTAPADALVTYVCTSPAIDVDNQPYGYGWHRQLAQLLDVSESPNLP
jgi:predicted deacylase